MTEQPIEIVRQKAPGCYGAASVYSIDSKACQSCVAFDDCGEESVRALQALKDKIDVRDVLARHTAARIKAEEERKREAAQRAAAAAAKVPYQIPAKPQPKPIANLARKTKMTPIQCEIRADDEAIILTLSVKARDQAIVFAKQNRIDDMRSQLPAGKNPFAESPPAFMRVACDLLLGGGFTRAALRDAYMRELGWKDSSAASHVSIAASILTGFGIAQDTAGSYVLNPALGA